MRNRLDSNAGRQQSGDEGEGLQFKTSIFLFMVDLPVISIRDERGQLRAAQ